MLALSPGGVTQVSVEVGVDKPRVGVVLHQAVDFPLSCQEAGGAGLAQALHDGVPGVEIQVDLSKEKHTHQPVLAQEDPACLIKLNGS